MFTNLKALSIPEGDVIKIEYNGSVLWSANALPNIYQQVEWIQAAANVGAYLNLGFAYNCGATIDLGIWILNDATAYPFGAAENGGRDRCCLSMPYVGNGASTGSFYFTLQSTNNYGSLPLEYALSTKNEYEIIINGSIISFRDINNNNYKSSGGVKSYTMTSNLYLFAQNYNGSARFGDIRRISYFKYYDKDKNLICDLIPCYRKSDSVIGMYDIARRMFLTNVGSGTFTKGADVN